jgi:hypothetical protein
MRSRPCSTRYRRATLSVQPESLHRDVIYEAARDVEGIALDAHPRRPSTNKDRRIKAVSEPVN